MTNAWSPRQKLPGTTRPSDDIATVVEPSGAQWALFKDSADGSAWELRIAHRRSNAPWLPAKVLTNIDNPLLPCMAVGPNGGKLAAWQETAHGVHQIGTAQFKRAAGANSEWVAGDGVTSDYHPAVAIDPQGGHHLVWSRGGTIYYAVKRRGQWDAERVSDVSGNFYYPSIAAGNDTLHVAFQDVANKDIRYTQRPLKGGAWSPSQHLALGKDVHLTERAGHMWACFTDEWNFATVLQYDGTRAPLLRRRAEHVGGYHVHGVIDSKGNLHCIWMQSIGGENYQIFYADCLNGQWSDSAPLPEQQNFSEGNSIAVDANDKLYVCYLESVNGIKSAYSTERQL